MSLCPQGGDLANVCGALMRTAVLPAPEAAALSLDLSCQHLTVKTLPIQGVKRRETGLIPHINLF